MPSILDRFVIELGLDGSKVQKGTKDAKKNLDDMSKAVGKTGKDFQDAGKTMSESFSKARNEALALIAVFTGGRSLKAFTSEITRANAQLGYTSQRLNVNAQNLFHAQNMVRAVGGNGSDIDASIGALQQKALDPAQSANLMRAFHQLHVDNWRSLQNDPTGMLKALNRGVQNIDPANRVNLLNQVGITGSTVDLINQSTESFDDLSKKLDSVKRSKEQIENSQQLQKDWNTLKLTTEGLSASLLDDFVPGLDAVIKEFILFEQKAPHWVEGVAGLAAVFVTLGSAIKGVMVMRGLSSLISGAKKAGLCGCEGGAQGLAKETATESATGGKSALKNKIGGPKISSKTIDTLAGDAVETSARRGLMRGALSLGLKGLPIVGEAAMLLDPNTANAGESDRVDRLRKQGAFGKFGFGMGPYEQYARAVAKIEGARYDQMGGYHNAYAGKYQMSRDAITDAARWLKESVPSTAQFLADPAMQERYFRAHTDQNFKYLMGHSNVFKSSNEMQRLAILGYAHNQGAAGAAKWLATGQAGRDGFGTSGTRYSDAISQSLSAYDKNSAVVTGVSGGVTINGDINVKTNATDAQGVARGIHSALSDPANFAHTNARGLQ